MGTVACVAGTREGEIFAFRDQTRAAAAQVVFSWMGISITPRTVAAGYGRARCGCAPGVVTTLTIEAFAYFV